jgi:hypothetical protein
MLSAIFFMVVLLDEEGVISFGGVPRPLPGHLRRAPEVSGATHNLLPPVRTSNRLVVRFRETLRRRRDACPGAARQQSVVSGQQAVR